MSSQSNEIYMTLHILLDFCFSPAQLLLHRRFRDLVPAQSSLCYIEFISSCWRVLRTANPHLSKGMQSWSKTMIGQPTPYSLWMLEAMPDLVPFQYEGLLFQVKDSHHKDETVERPPSFLWDPLIHFYAHVTSKCAHTKCHAEKYWYGRI